MNRVRSFYDKWRAPLTEMLNGTIYLAYGGGKVKYENDEWGVFCHKNGTCYASFYIRNESSTYQATVDKNPKCFFEAEGVTYSTDGNTVTLTSKSKYRSAIVKFEGDVLDESKSKTGLIVGLVVGFIVLIVIIVIVVFILMKKKNNDNGKQSDEGKNI